MQSTGSAQDVSVAPALPIEMDFSLPSSLPSAKNFEIRVQPVNAQSFQAGNVVQIDIPCGRRGQYLDPATSYIRFRSTYTHAGAVLTDFSRLIGSAYSYFIKQELYANNSVILESINECGVLASMLMNCQLNDADKRGLSPAMGFASNESVIFTAASNTYPAAITTQLVPYQSSATTGHRIFAVAATNENLVHEYSIPLMGILGCNTTDKFIPIGALFGLRLELTMDNYTNFVLDSTANATTGCTIDAFEFVANVIELAPEAQAIIESANPDKIHIRTSTFRQASNALAASTSSGTNDLLIGVRVSSLKSVYMCCSPSNAAEKKFAGVNPNLDQGTCLIIAGQQYPQRTINPSNRPSDTFMELQKSFGSLAYSTFNGCIQRIAYNTSSTAYGLCAAYNTAVGSVVNNPNQFYLGIDTEVVARKQNLLSGINVNSSPMFFRAQIGSAISANTHTLNFWGFYDVILELDVGTKNMIAKY